MSLWLPRLLKGIDMTHIKGLDRGQKAALLISECQNAMTRSGYPTVATLSAEVEKRNMVANIAALSAVCRENGVRVIHCTLVALADFSGFTVCSPLMASIKKRATLVEGNEASAINPHLALQADDLEIRRRHGVSGFHGTELEPILRGLGVETVILCGVSTGIAIPGMTTEAVNRGFNVVIPEDCTASGTAESHDFQIRYHLPALACITTSAEVAAALGQHNELSDSQQL